jgi:2-desacetyl-2-hydroxyethyl bacteriochlorophyllide A dehydrogenase
MKAVVKIKREPGIEVLDVKVPEVGDSDILVKVLAGSLCGSDVHVYEWTPNYEWMPLPVILGHEFAGEVFEVGSKVKTVAVGDRITAMPAMACGCCPLCQVGRGDACSNRLGLGLSTNGAFAEYVRLTAASNIFKLPEGLSYEAASLCEPLCVALRAVDLSNIKVGQTAVVLGPGPIGLLTLQLVKVAGAGLVMVAGTAADARRLEIARRLGADITIDVDREDLVSKVTEVIGRDFSAGLDFVFEATGNPVSVTQAVSMVRRGGKVVLIGIHPAPAEFNTTDLVRSSKSIIGAYGYDTETWRRSLLLLSSGKIRVEPMITHRIPFSNAKEGFELAIRREAAKVLFIP